MLTYWSLFLPFFVGAAVGSFLNVVVWRLPRRESIVHPPSHCPRCNHRLGVLDLFPLLSFLALRARCRYCQAPVSWRYFWVELVTALLWAGLWAKYAVGRDPEVLPTYLYTFLAHALFVSTLIPIFLIDLELFIIPDELNAVLLFIGLALAALVPASPTPWGFISLGDINLLNALIGAQFGVLFWAAIAFFGRLLFGRDALGHGDIKMARGIGALLMLPGAAAAFGIAVFLGVLTGIPLMMRNQGSEPETPTPVEEEESAPPESPLSILVHTVYYLLWIDVIALFLPKRTQFNLEVALERATGNLPAGFDPELEWTKLQAPPEEDDFRPTLTTIPFGPSLVGGALAVIYFGPTLVGWYKAYLLWAFPE